MCNWRSSLLNLHIITKREEAGYREGLWLLTEWCAANNLLLNTTKTKEVILDFCKTAEDYTPLYINGDWVETMASFWLWSQMIRHSRRIHEWWQWRWYSVFTSCKSSVKTDWTRSCLCPSTVPQSRVSLLTAEGHTHITEDHQMLSALSGGDCHFQMHRKSQESPWTVLTL